MSEDIKVTDGTVLEALNNKVDLDGGNYKGSELEAYIHEHCGANPDLSNLSETGQAKFDEINADIEVLQTRYTATKAYLKTTYVNGASGYNIWSNGYCEQWGQGSASTGSAKVTLLKTFANTNYNIQLTASYTESSGGVSTGVAVHNTSKATTGFTISQYSKANYTAYWRACGYLASGQY